MELNGAGWAAWLAPGGSRPRRPKGMKNPATDIWNPPAGIPGPAAPAVGVTNTGVCQVWSGGRLRLCVWTLRKICFVRAEGPGLQALRRE